MEIESRNNSKSRCYDGLKRIMDVFLGILAMIVLIPIFIAVYIAVKVDSKGKAIYSSKRVGKNGEIFKIYKFRSMYENSEEIFNNFTEEQKKEFYTNFKLENDPRITKVGQVIRKTSLDEIPQIINIIMGDMSIVGPRPISEGEIDKYGSDFKKVFSVTPGLTGYWQANGRSDTSYEERVEMDIYYIDNRSLLLDIDIMFKTVIAVIKKEGAV